MYVETIYNVFRLFSFKLKDKRQEFLVESHFGSLHGAWHYNVQVLNCAVRKNGSESTCIGGFAWTPETRRLFCCTAVVT